MVRSDSRLPLETLKLSDSDITDVEVFATDRQTAVAASLEPAELALQHFVVLFPVDETLRSTTLGRVRTAQPSGDGTFEVRQLQGGDYWVCALGMSAPPDWWRPSFLSEIVPLCGRVSVQEGERKTVTLKLRK